jgi:nucleotidyltransferase substrate binding protein (TIGR01987 family)
MEIALEQNFKDLNEALQCLKESLIETPDPKQFIIDATTRRFKLCIELFWKNFKNLLEKEGKETLSPRQSISQAYQMQWFDNEQLWLKMIDDRNATSHTYKKVKADQIYQNIKQYYPEMKKTYEKLQKVYFSD